MMAQHQELAVLKKYLAGKKLRLSHPRKVILQAFLESSGHVEIWELCEKVKKIDKSIGLTTVYRTMDLLVQCGLAKENILLNSRKCFERVHGLEHHDHMVCHQCKGVKEFHHPMIERYQEETAEKHQFALIFHRMTLFGICKDCKQ